MGIESDIARLKLETGETEDYSLPQPATRRSMNSTCGIPHIVLQIDRGSLPEIEFGPLGISNLRSNRCADCRAEAAAVAAARIIIFEIGLFDILVESMRKEVEEHQYIRLFDHLSETDRFLPKDHIHGS